MTDGWGRSVEGNEASPMSVAGIAAVGRGEASDPCGNGPGDLDGTTSSAAVRRGAVIRLVSGAADGIPGTVGREIALGCSPSPDGADASPGVAIGFGAAGPGAASDGGGGRSDNPGAADGTGGGEVDMVGVAAAPFHRPVSGSAVVPDGVPDGDRWLSGDCTCGTGAEGRSIPGVAARGSGGARSGTDGAISGWSAR